MWLVSNQRDGLRISFETERSSSLKAGLPCADDDHSTHCCVGGVLTIRPSNSLVTRSWQLRRLFESRGEAVESSIAFSSSSIGWKLRQPARVNVDVTRRAHAGAAAFGDDAVHTVLDGAFHNGIADRDIYDSCSAGIGVISDGRGFLRLFSKERHELREVS